MFKPYGVPVERLFDGRPILSPGERWWENSVTFNSAAVYLNNTPSNRGLIQTLVGNSDMDDALLKEGIVALHYRARPKSDPGYLWTRSFTGLALFTPRLELIKRYDHPIVLPGAHEEDCDYLGIEDPRIARIDDMFYMTYCGSTVDRETKHGFRGRNCLARSKDLLHWEKLGVVKGDPDLFDNKDGVLFPDKIDGHYFLLHRPWGSKVGGLSDFHSQIALSDSINGKWKNCGIVLRAFKIPDCSDSWNGAGSVPIPVGNKRYLVIYHTGNWHKSGEKEYDLDAALFDFSRFSPDHPEQLVVGRIEPLMVPQTRYERESPFSASEPNTLFTCGTYEYKDWIYIIYGGGDTYIMAARVNRQELLEALENAPDGNPYVQG